MNAKVIYAAAPIREIAVECPKCKKWFRGRDITDCAIQYEVDIPHAYFKCPACGENFNGFDDVKYPACPDLGIKVLNVNIKTVYSENECYKDCLKGRVVWESPKKTNCKRKVLKSKYDSV